MVALSTGHHIARNVARAERVASICLHILTTTAKKPSEPHNKNVRPSELTQTLPSLSHRTHRLAHSSYEYTAFKETEVACEFPGTATRYHYSGWPTATTRQHRKFRSKWTERYIDNKRSWMKKLDFSEYLILRPGRYFFYLQVLKGYWPLLLIWVTTSFLTLFKVHIEDTLLKCTTLSVFLVGATVQDTNYSRHRLACLLSLWQRRSLYFAHTLYLRISYNYYNQHQLFPRTIINRLFFVNWHALRFLRYRNH
jgi:hypothetical protein